MEWELLAGELDNIQREDGQPLLLERVGELVGVKARGWGGTRNSNSVIVEISNPRDGKGTAQGPQRRLPHLADMAANGAMACAMPKRGPKTQARITDIPRHRSTVIAVGCTDCCRFVRRCGYGCR